MTQQQTPEPQPAAPPPPQPSVPPPSAPAATATPNPFGWQKNYEEGDINPNQAQMLLARIQALEMKMLELNGRLTMLPMEIRMEAAGRHRELWSEMRDLFRKRE